jgi:1,4-alpha-glucan branching enzyme
VRNFLVANALYWFEEFHVDGLRVDAVASMLYLDYSREAGEWEPNIYGGRENLEAIRFLQEVNATAYKRYPGIAMIAEESTSFPGVTAPTSAAAGFGFKWNMGWMNDSLEYFKRDPMYRSPPRGRAVVLLVYAFSENFILPISHDEVVHGKGTLFTRMPGDHWQKLANARLPRLHVGHPGKQLLFMGQDFGSCRSGPRAADWTGGCSTSRRTGSCRTSSARSTASTASSRRCGRATATAAPSVASVSRLEPERHRVLRASTTTATPSRSSATSPALPSRTSRSTCRPARGESCSTPTPPTAARGGQPRHRARR